jgi:hypothetical protein
LTPVGSPKEIVPKDLIIVVEVPIESQAEVVLITNEGTLEESIPEHVIEKEVVVERDVNPQNAILQTL